MKLVGTIVVLSILVGVKAVLGLGHAVTTVGVLVPGLLGISSTLGVKGGVVLENTSLLHISLVVTFLLGDISLANFLVFGLAQTLGDIGLSSKLASLEL